MIRFDTRPQVVAGSGESLLADIATTDLDLQNVTDLGNGAVVLTYALGR